MKNIVRRDAGIRSHSRRVCALLSSTVLIMVLSAVNGRAVRANSQAQRQAEPASSEPLVIQGRITAIQGTIVTVKTPYGYPGARGGHPQYVTAGPTFRVDVAHAHILLPDGRRQDRVPLAVGDRVLVVLSGPDLSPPVPGNVNQTYFASIIERLALSDRIVTH